VYGYQQHQNSSDFHVWTFAYDVSGMQSVTLKFRTDLDGSNPLTNDDNDVYAGGSGVTAWQSLPMTSRVFPTGNVTGNGSINFFILPDYIANEYYAEITGLHDTLVDYYIEAVDQNGNVTKTPIQHVYVGGSNPGGGQNGIYWVPTYPTIDDTVTVHVPSPDTTALLHWGVNGWTQPNAAYWPIGSTLFQGTGPALQSRMDTLAGELLIQLGPFNNVAQSVSMVDFVIHYDNNTWDNNGGGDYHIPISQPVAVQAAGSELRVDLWPNPASNDDETTQLRIQDTGDPRYCLELLDVTGTVLSKEKVGSGTHRLQTEVLPAGMYFLRVTGTETRRQTTQKLVVQ
jgi:hypothetical protein